MSAKKYSLFKNSRGSSSDVILNAQKKGSNSSSSRIKQNEDKRIAERLLEAIRGKLKDPDMAKKAALIIEEMMKGDKPKK